MAKKETCPDLELLLAARLVPKAPQFSGYRLKMWPAGMVSAHCGDDIIKSTDIDVKKMAVTARISTPTPDLSRDIVIGEGIDYAVHQLNPLVLLLHDPKMPIAKAVDSDGNYTIRMVGDDTLATSYFFQDSPESEQAFRLAEIGALPGTSVKIQPLKAKQVRGENGDGPYVLIEKSRLFEYSHVFFPDNPEALVVAVEKGLGGKPMVDRLKQLFAPLLPIRPAMVNGATLEKCAGDCGCAKCKGASATCVASKIPRLRSEGYNQDQAIAIANHMCGEDDTGDGTDDQRPTGPTNMDDPRPQGAQYGSALYEMSVAMSEFAEQQGAGLEPESAEAYAGVHEHIRKLMDHVASIHNTRYPGLTRIGTLDDPIPEREETMKSRTEAEEHRHAARALVRGWWKNRMVAVAEAEAGPVKEVVAFLTKAASHRGPWGNAEKAKAAALIKKFSGEEKPAPVAVQAAVDDWADVEQLLQAREKALASFGQVT